jgi:hypothetical protein
MIRKCIAALFLITSASSAFALINAEVLYGKRWYYSEKADGSKFSSKGPTLSIGINSDPLPVVPFSIGVSYTRTNLDKADFGTASSVEIRQVGFDFKIWAPMVPFVTPYARLRYLLLSRLKITNDNIAQETDTKLNGYLLGIGASYSILPMISALVEYSQSFEKADSFEGDSKHFDSKSLSIGLQVGI